MATSGRSACDQKGETTSVIRKVCVARVRLQDWFMHVDVVSGVPVMFERPANRLSGYKDQEGGALSLQNQVCDQVESGLPFLLSHIWTDLFSCGQALCRPQSSFRRLWIQALFIFLKQVVSS